MSAAANSLSVEISELQDEVKTYKPGGASRCPDRVEFPENLYIGLFGKTGCGKTSLINSMKFAAIGRLRKAQWEQVAPQDMAGGHTMYRILANITDHIYVIDNRGNDNPSSAQAIEELSAQLEGKRSYNKVVKWQGERAGDDWRLAARQHPIGCAVFVFSALHDLEDNTSGIAHVVDHLHMQQGRYPVAVITHVDVADPAAVEALCTVLRSTGVSDIFKVKNLTEEQPKLDKNYQLNLLNLMEKCMIDGDKTLIFKHYQRKGVRMEKAREQQRQPVVKDPQTKIVIIREFCTIQ